MSKEKFSPSFENQPAPESEEELTGDVEISKIDEKIIDESIKENPKGFLDWFQNLKDSIGAWPKKFLENKTIRNSIIYTSIPFAVLLATKSEIKAEDIVSEFIQTPTITEKAEAELLEPKIKAENLVSLADESTKEAVAEQINKELYAFDKLSDVFNKEILEKPNLFPKEIIEKVALGGKVFDFAGQAESKINEANQYFQEISVIDNKNLKEEKSKVHIKKILEDGRLNFIELAKILPEIVLAQKLSVLIHESGHERAAIEQGARGVSTKFDLFGGYTGGKGRLRNAAVFHAAGINIDKTFGEFLVDNLREKGSPSQLLAILALAAKSEGMLYSLGTNFIPALKEHKGNDILQYVKATNTPISELSLGLTADFILDRDNWNLIKIALGKEGVKMPKTTLAPMYELGERGPIVGIKFKGIF